MLLFLFDHNTHNFQLNSNLFSVVGKAFCVLVEGEAVGAACEHVGVCVQRKTGILGFDVTSI